MNGLTYSLAVNADMAVKAANELYRQRQNGFKYKTDWGEVREHGIMARSQFTHDVAFALHAVLSSVVAVARDADCYNDILGEMMRLVEDAGYNLAKDGEILPKWNDGLKGNLIPMDAADGGMVPESYIRPREDGPVCPIPRASVIFEGQKLTFDAEDSERFAELVKGHFRKLAGLEAGA